MTFEAANIWFHFARVTKMMAIRNGDVAPMYMKQWNKKRTVVGMRRFPKLRGGAVICKLFCSYLLCKYIIKVGIGGM